MKKNTCTRILIFAFVLLLFLNNPSFAGMAPDDIITSGKEFLSKGEDPYKYINPTQLYLTSDSIYNVLLGIAIFLAVIVAMILGIQFMWASADEKAKVKEALMPFVIGCIVVFGAFTIWKIVVNIGNQTEGTIAFVSTTDSTHDEHGLGICDCDIVYGCIVCGGMFSDEEEQENHECLICSACGGIFGDLEAKKNHMCCSVCGQAFSGEKEMEEHECN